MLHFSLFYHSLNREYRYRLTSASDEDDDDVHPLYDDYDVSQHMAERERLQEFAGRIPDRKKRDTVNRQPRKSRVSIKRLICNIYHSLI